MDLKELLDCCKAEAIANTVRSTEVSIWRQICRHYSKKFSTPLHLCLDGTIPPEDIILAEFEDQLDDFDENTHLQTILDQIYRLQDPTYDAEQSKELENFIKKVEAQEEERIRLGKPIHKSMKNEAKMSIPDNKPKQGMVNLAYLEKEELEGQNFED